MRVPQCLVLRPDWWNVLHDRLIYTNLAVGCQIFFEADSVDPLLRTKKDMVNDTVTNYNTYLRHQLVNYIQQIILNFQFG